MTERWIKKYFMCPTSTSPDVDLFDQKSPPRLYEHSQYHHVKHQRQLYIQQGRSRQYYIKLTQSVPPVQDHC